MNASASSGRAEELPLSLQRPLERFLAVMRHERGLAANTVDAYSRDLRRYLQYLTGLGVQQPGDISREHVSTLLESLRQAGLSPATVARNFTSLRRFHRFLVTGGAATSDPTEGLGPPRLDRKLPDLLSVVEVERLLAAPSLEEDLGLRDRAILEVLYAAGLRVSELIALELDQLRLEEGLVLIRGAGSRERLVPLGEPAVDFLNRYLQRVRPSLVTGAGTHAVFLNARGGPLSRMGVWKTIRRAADRASVSITVSPQTLRHSFAAHLLDGGASLRVVQTLLGHAGIETTQVYARLNRQDLRAVHRRYHPRA